jgi:SSS family solute:Na+ symporter
MYLESLDLTVVAIYAAVLLFIAQWVSREKGGHQKDTKDYFLAGRSLPWWAIGASLIAANISAEQIIGMSGSAFVMGIAIASYEWMSALTLVIVAKYLLPVFLKHQIYTMPQFLHHLRCHRACGVCGSLLVVRRTQGGSADRHHSGCIAGDGRLADRLYFNE